MENSTIQSDIRKFRSYTYETFTELAHDKAHLLLVMEVFSEEMDYALKNGTEKLIAKLEAAGHYPYSDLDRKSVI